MPTEEKREYYLQLEKDVINELREDPRDYQRYLDLNSEWQQRFLDFCTGLRTMPLTYDPFFKKIFHPDIHPERLSRFISSLIERNVKVVRILPTEDNLLSRDSLLVMDILVELEDSSLANVEIQKIPYFFPAERMSCYSADLLLRQYSRVKGEKGKGFKYNDLKKVYTIIIFEKSVNAFGENEEQYIHMGRTIFNTGLKLELLQEYCLVALDVFKKIPYSKVRSERAAWLGLLATESVETAVELAAQYPWLVEIYKEMADYMKDPKEVLDMFSEALHILDSNTTNYMIEEQQAEIEAGKKEIALNRKRIKEQQKEIEEQERALKEQDKTLKEQDKTLKEQDKTLKEQDKTLKEQSRVLEEKDRELQEKERELERLRELLKNKALCQELG